jgi:hypothetical protein
MWLENGGLAFLIRNRKIRSEMKTNITLVFTLLAILVCFVAPQAGLSHGGANHAAHRSQKARAIAKCRLKSTPEEKRACLAKVKKRFGN